MTGQQQSKSQQHHAASLIVSWSISGKNVLVVGGDSVAASRAVFALEANALVTVIASAAEIDSTLMLKASNGEIKWHDRKFVASDLTDKSMVFVCLDDALASRTIGLLCRERSIPDKSLQFAISTNGNGPRLASKIRRQLAFSLPSASGDALDRLAILRQRLRSVDPATSSNGRRMMFVNKVSDAWSIQTIADLTDKDIDVLVNAYLSDPHGDLPKVKAGTLRIVKVVSADPDLLTHGAYRALIEAELVVADANTPQQILDLVAGDLLLLPAPGSRSRASSAGLAAALHALEQGQGVVRLRSSAQEEDDELSQFTRKGYQPIIIPSVSIHGQQQVHHEHVVPAPVKAFVPHQPAHRLPLNEDDDSKARSVPAIAEPVVEKITAVKPKVAHPLHAIGAPTLISGEEAAAHVAYRLSDLSFVYPLAAESKVADKISAWSAEGVPTASGKTHSVQLMSTRQGAGSIVHGAASTGSTVSVLAASQSLPFMIPTMYQMAATKLPVVMHVSSSAVNHANLTVSQSISDVLATTSTGFSLLSSGSVKESHDLAIVAHVAAQVARTPFLHFFDGARIATEKAKVPVMSTNDLAHVVHDAVHHASSVKHIPVPDLVENVMGHLSTRLGHAYSLFEYVGDSSAESVIVTLGANATVAESAVHKLVVGGHRVGLLKIRLLRPWSARHFLAALPRTVKRIAVIDPSTEKPAGNNSSPLFLDVTSAFYNSAWTAAVPSIHFGQFKNGLEHVQAKVVEEFLVKFGGHAGGARVPFHFVLEASAADFVKQSGDSNVVESVFWDLQSDHTAGASERIVHALNGRFDFVQASTSHAAVQIDPVSVTQVRYGKSGHYTSQEIKNADFVAVHNVSILSSYNVAATVKHGGTILLNYPGSHAVVDLEKELPADFRKEVQRRALKLVVLDAHKIASNYTLFRGDRNEYVRLVLEAAFYKLAKGLNFKERVEALEAHIADGVTDNTIYRTKMGALATALRQLAEVKAPASWAAAADKEGVAAVGSLPTSLSVTLPLKKLHLREEDDDEEVVGRAVKRHHSAWPIMFKEAYGVKSQLRPDTEEKTYTIRVSENRRLTPESYERNVFHVEFDMQGSGLKYDIGEALGVFGHNDAAEVKSFIDFYGLNPAQVVQYDRKTESGTVESEFRTVEQLLTQVVDLFGKPGKKFYQFLVEHAADMSEREKIGWLGSAEGAADLEKLIEEETPTFADVLRSFPSARPSLDALLAAIPAIKPRHYSISSSMNVHPTSVHLLVVVVDWETKSGKKRFGQCTRYLVGLKPGDLVTVSVKPSAMKMPESHEAPVIMAGLGTGMAPFRAFVEERAYQRSLGKKIEAESEMLEDYMLQKDGAFYLCGPTWPVPDIKNALVKAFKRRMSEDEAEVKLEELKEHERYILEVY
ncbi:hypothetical protein HDU76_005796 [Blyttiomyces sp. JEL0837]|nr:hypothetical protein HDU76_005796 [Blyttiomyces sp. JEL0837]